MLSGSVIFYKIASMCLLIFVGFLARRMKLVPENSLTALSHYILSVATPAFILSNMPQTISLETVSSYWYFPALGAGLVAFCDLFAWASARLMVRPAERPTFRFLAAFPNWMFLAMAVIEPLFAADGVRVVLLFNVGITGYIWSFGLTGFKEGFGWHMVKNIFLNLQVVATVAGVGLALAVPFLATAHGMPAAELARLPVHLGAVTTVWEAVTLIGSTALPLSIFQIGLRLAGTEGGRTVAELTERADNRALVACSATRLILAPILVVFALVILARLGLPLTESEFLVSAIIFAMPTAVASLVVTDVYGGDTLLAARAVLWMTLASMGTVPLVGWLAQLALKAAFP